MNERDELARHVTSMLARVARGGDDIEANYCRSLLQTQLLEIYFKARGRPFPGPEAAFAWLRANDSAAYALYDQALMPDAGRGALRRLAEKVLEPLS